MNKNILVESLVENTFDGLPFIRIPFFAIQSIGIINSALLIELLDWKIYLKKHENLPKDNWFYHEQKEISKKLNITKKTIWKGMKILENMGFIKIKRKGIPPKNYYYINYENIAEMILNPDNFKSSILEDSNIPFGNVKGLPNGHSRSISNISISNLSNEDTNVSSYDNPKGLSERDVEDFINGDDNKKSFPKTKQIQKQSPSKRKGKAESETPTNIDCEFILHWNSKKNLTKHRPGTKRTKKIKKYLNLLRAGKFRSVGEIDLAHLDKFNVDHECILRKWTREEILEAIDRYNQMFEDGKGPKYKGSLTTSMDTFIYNEGTHSSLFLTVAGPGREVKATMAKAIDEKAVSIYEKRFFKNLNETEKNKLVVAVNIITKRYREWYEDYGQYAGLSKLKDHEYYRTHCQYLRDKFADNGHMEISKIRNEKIWADYVHWIRQFHGSEYNLDPSNREMRDAKRSHKERLERLDQEMRLKEQEKAEEERDEIAMWDRIARKGNLERITHHIEKLKKQAKDIPVYILDALSVAEKAQNAV